jgi:alkylhydroperoxidase/carboxymuconolactone decarboxylase family protein YurZ
MPVLHSCTYQKRPSKGATEKEIVEAIWVAAEMRAGAAIAHSAIALDVMKEHARSE